MGGWRFTSDFSIPRHPLKPDAPDKTEIAFANDDVPGGVHRNTAALANLELVRCIEISAVAAVDERIPAESVQEQMHDISGIYIPELRAIMQEEKIPAGRHGPNPA